MRHQSRTENPCETVLVDLDGVLLRGDAFTNVVVRALLQRPWRMPAAAGLLALRAAAPRWGSRRTEISRALVRLALRGHDADSYARLAEATGASLGLGRKRVDALVERVEAHRVDGLRVVIVTASERQLVRSFLDAVGLKEVELVATDLEFSDENQVDICIYNLGPQKVRSVVASGIDPGRCLFYTDSAADLPLIRLVASCTLVDPSPATLRAVGEANLTTPLQTLWVNRRPK